jgi:hypothetical protein
MRIGVLIFLGSILYSTVILADVDATFSSRNMPVSCEFVFRVDSDLSLVLPVDSDEDYILYQLQNTWVPSDWTEAVAVPLQLSWKGRVGEWSFQSMSIPGNYLYRIIKIILPKSKKTCFAEFGRQFGETCKSDGRDSTPWRVRVLSCD